jgi:hypothetical protein
LEKDIGSNLLGLALYGSFARGDFTASSDLDLIVVFGVADRSPFKRIDLVLPAVIRARNSDAYRSLARLGYTPDFSPLIYQADELQNTPSIFIDAAHEAVIIADTGVLRQKFLQVRRRMKQLGARKVRVGRRDSYWVLKPALKLGEVVEI